MLVRAKKKSALLGEPDGKCYRGKAKPEKDIQLVQFGIDSKLLEKSIRKKEGNMLSCGKLEMNRENMENMLERKEFKGKDIRSKLKQIRKDGSIVSLLGQNRYSDSL